MFSFISNLDVWLYIQTMKVPWRSIMTSLPAWAIGITTFGRIWVHYTFIIPGPMYMKTVLGFSIQKVSFWLRLNILTILAQLQYI